MLFDLNDESKTEKPVFPGANQFAISADGKKLLVGQGRQLLILDPAPARSRPPYPPMA